MRFKLASCAALAIAIACGGTNGALAHPSTVSRSEMRVGAWRLAVLRDDFVGVKTCRLTARHLGVERDTLIVHLPPHIDTMNAVYRIDGGPPIAAASDDALMAEKGFALRADILDNPSGGIVRIPRERLAAAKQLRIETAIGKVWTFDLTGLQAGLDAMTGAGCA